MHSFFFRSSRLITTLLLIHDSYMGWSTRFISIKICVEFSIFDSVSCLLSLYVCLTKSMDSLTLKRNNSLQNKNNRKTTTSFSPRPLIFKLQQEVWKFNDICVKWNPPKKWPGDEILKIRKSKFLVRHFFSTIAFK